MQQPSFEPYAAPAEDQPQTPGEKIRFGEALRFAFRSEKPWSNVLLATLMMFVPVAGPIALMGWHAEIMQRLVRRHPTPVPPLEFTDFTHYITRGVQPFVSQMLASLPISFLAVFGAMIGGVGGGIAARSGGPEVILVIWGVMALVMFVTMPFMWVVLNAVVTRADLVEEVGATLKMGELGRYMRATWLTVIGTFMVFAMLSVGFVLVGMLVFCIGAYVASSIMQLAQLHLRWQIYERYVARGGAPIQPKPPVVLPSEQARAQAYAQHAQYGQYAPGQYPQYGQPR